MNCACCICVISCSAVSIVLINVLLTLCVNLQDGETALHVASNVEVVDYLLRIGLNIEDCDTVFLLTLLLLTCSYCFKLFSGAIHHFFRHVVIVVYL